jgi:predicted RNase H-like HicB family nuclease
MAEYVEYTKEAYELACRPYQAIIWHSDDEPDIWYVRHPELPGCMSDGRTPAEAEDNLLDARLLYIQCLLDDGIPVPEPDTAVRRLVIESNGEFHVGAYA